MVIRVDTRWVLLALCVLFLTGAQRNRLVDPIQWVEPEQWRAPQLKSVISESIAVVAGEAVPFDGVLLAGDSAYRVQVAYDTAVKAEASCQRWRREDRYFADRVHGAVVEGLKTCRKSKIRDFGAGVGVGFAGCAGIGWAVESRR